MTVEQMYTAFLFHIWRLTVILFNFFSVLFWQLACHEVALAQAWFEGNICVDGEIKSQIYRPSSSARNKRKCCKHSSRLYLRAFLEWPELCVLPPNTIIITWLQHLEYRNQLLGQIKGMSVAPVTSPQAFKVGTVPEVHLKNSEFKPKLKSCQTTQKYTATEAKSCATERDANGQRTPYQPFSCRKNGSSFLWVTHALRCLKSVKVKAAPGRVQVYHVCVPDAASDRHHPFLRTCCTCSRDATPLVCNRSGVAVCTGWYLIVLCQQVSTVPGINCVCPLETRMSP